MSVKHREVQDKVFRFENAVTFTYVVILCSVTFQKPAANDDSQKYETLSTKSRVELHLVHET